MRAGPAARLLRPARHQRALCTTITGSHCSPAQRSPGEPLHCRMFVGWVNATFILDYKASIAQWHAERRGRRPKVAKLVANDRLREFVQVRLAGAVMAADGMTHWDPDGPVCKGRNKSHGADRRWVQGWSPQQIARRLRVDFPDDDFMRISHEAIYQALYIQSRSALKRELVACLRTGRVSPTAGWDAGAADAETPVTRGPRLDRSRHGSQDSPAGA